MPRWVLRLLLLRPVMAAVRWVANRLDSHLLADFEYRFIATSVSDGREVQLEECVRRTFRVASAAEKQVFCAFIEDFSRQDQHTLEYMEGTFDEHRSLIEAHRGSLTGLKVLELGPGHALVAGLLLYVHGIAQYTGADFFPIAGRGSTIYRRLRTHLAFERPLIPGHDFERNRAEALRRFDEAVDLTGTDARFNENLVAWRHPVDAAKLPFEDGSFDVVISNAAFEHFIEPEAAVREAARVLAPGGVGIHQIDLRDHRNFEKPLDFLRYEDDEWRRLNADMVCYTNRVRFRDFERLFAASAAVERAEVRLEAPVDPAVRAQLHARFRDRDDLDALSVLFVVRKR